MYTWSMQTISLYLTFTLPSPKSQQRINWSIESSDNKRSEQGCEKNDCNANRFVGCQFLSGKVLPLQLKPPRISGKCDRPLSLHLHWTVCSMLARHRGVMCAMHVTEGGCHQLDWVIIKIHMSLYSKGLYSQWNYSVMKFPAIRHASACLEELVDKTKTNDLQQIVPQAAEK